MTEVITISRLNNLQSRIALILGNGSGDRGYGQPVSSLQIANTSSTIVRAEDINKIYIDLIKARIHQVGYSAYTSSNLKIFRVLQNTSSIGLDSSPNVVINLETGEVQLVEDADSQFRGIADYELLMDAIETDKFVAHSSQMSIQSGTQSVRTTPWNTSLYHEFSVNFRNADHRRYFFNSGGKLFLNSNLTNPGNLKAEDWAAFLASTGTITFGHTETTGQQTGSLIGNYDLTATYQKIYERIGGGTVSGVYSGNLITIYAKELSSSTITFKVEFSDVAQDSNVDDVIVGRLESSVSCLLAEGMYNEEGTTYTSVMLDAPTFSNLKTIDSFASPLAIYSLYTNRTSVVKDDTFKITISTLNIADSTPVPYTITGVTSNDITGAPLSDSFIINSNTAFKTFTVANNINENKTFELKLNSLPNKINILFNQSVAPLPTSLNRTCIAVIDESSVSASTLRNNWIAFRQRWPNRPFYLLQPGRATTDLKIPAEFTADPLAFYRRVNRDNNNISQRSDWYALCNIASLPDFSNISLFIDVSGSMALYTVKASYDYFISQLTARNMSTTIVSDGRENWITPFDRILN